MLKVDYISYLKVIKANPAYIEKRKIVPGDEVIIPLELEKGARELLELEPEVAEDKAPEPVCPKCKKIVKRCVCEKLAKQKARKKVVKDVEEKKEKAKEPQKGQKNEDGKIIGDEAEIDPLTAEIVKLRKSLKQEGKTKDEIKKAVADLKKSKGE